VAESIKDMSKGDKLEIQSLFNADVKALIKIIEDEMIRPNNQ